jgi:ubiquitin carboxyl-terminal hydrolase 34
MIDQVNGDTLHLAFVYDVKTADRYLDRWSLEIAQHETKTKESWEWRKTLGVNSLVDGFDKTIWNKSTILEIKDQEINEGRSVKLALIAFRIYTPDGKRTDEKGATFDGWSNKFDEWISIYSPRIQTYLTKTLKGQIEDNDLNDEMDHLIKPIEGHARVYAVPRVRRCSSLLMRIINMFGNEGGLDLVLDCLRQDLSAPPKFEGLPINLNILGILVSTISYPYSIYHREFITEYAPKFVDLSVHLLRNAPDKSLRDVRRERIESIIKSIDNFQRRLVTVEEREKQTEVLKLEVALMCLKSSFLERKIQGIKDLNTVILNNRMFSFKSISAAYLIEWLEQNGVYSVVFEAKHTHRELVQRSGDILKLLLNEKKLSAEVLDMFWSLGKVGEYRVEVYKIINELSIWLGQEHIEHIYRGIRLIPPEQMTNEEFHCLCELGKVSKDSEFKRLVSDFFWDIVCNSDQYKDDLVTNCISKFCEMVKYWDVPIKHKLFLSLT